MKHHYQVLVGAGPSGSSLALTLARQGIEVMLVEQSRFDKLRVGELLSPRGQTVLDCILPVARNHFLTELEVTGAWSLPFITPLTPDPDQRWWAVDRTALDRSLAQAAQRRGADLRVGHRVDDLRREGQAWVFRLQETDSRADWLVDASGRAAKIGRILGGRSQRFDRQVALVGFLGTILSEETTPSVGSLPLLGCRCR